MYLHCCHLLPLCSWCYCCGSLLLMFISYKCHTQSTDIAGPQYKLSVVAQSTDNRPVNDPPTTFVFFFCGTYSNMAGIFCTIGYFIKFCSTTKIAQRIWQLFLQYFLSEMSSQAVIWERTVWQVGCLADWQYGARSCFPYGGHAVFSINCKRVLHALAIACQVTWKFCRVY